MRRTQDGHEVQLLEFRRQFDIPAADCIERFHSAEQKALIKRQRIDQRTSTLSILDGSTTTLRTPSSQIKVKLP